MFTSTYISPGHRARSISMSPLRSSDFAELMGSFSPPSGTPHRNCLTFHVIEMFPPLIPFLRTEAISIPIEHLSIRPVCPKPTNGSAIPFVVATPRIFKTDAIGSCRHHHYVQHRNRLLAHILLVSKVLQLDLHFNTGINYVDSTIDLCKVNSAENRKV